MMDACNVIDQVWVGGWSAARDNGKDFDLIVNCAKDAPHYGHFQFNLVDGPGNDQSEFNSAVGCVVEAMKTRRKVLVHCVAGMSRSLTVAAAAISKVYGMPLDYALDICKKARGCEPVRPFCPHDAMIALARKA
jgi:hypothetical protein